MGTMKAFFPKSGHFFQFSKRAYKASPLLPPLPPPSSAPVSVVEYTSVYLNMSKDP